MTWQINNHEYSKNELWAIVERYTVEKENEVIKEYFINQKSMSQIARESGLSIHRIQQIFTSIVEHLAEKRIEAEERYKRHLAEIKEMHRKRLERNLNKPEK